MRADNPQCDGAGPHSMNLEVRRYPTGGGGAAILCRACVDRENQYRAMRRSDKANPVDPAAFPRQSWLDLEAYE